MPRNLERRVEILFPVENEELKVKLKHILDGQLKDTEKAHVLNAKGIYERVDRRGKEIYSSQDAFCEEAIAAAKENKDITNPRVFIPETHHE